MLIGNILSTFNTVVTLEKHIILKKNEERRIISGHQWIFSNEIHTVSGKPTAGDVVEILRSDGKTLGIGFYHPHSLIAVRFLSSVIEEINEQYFERRIVRASELRKRIFPESKTFRLAHGESDFLPGLIIDKYDDYFSIQTFSAGMDKRLPMICDVLEKIFSPKGIVERNESTLRELESLPVRKSVLRGTIEPAIVELHGIRFTIDIFNGQKSGFFLDQRDNRILLKPFVKDKSVLDCFCNEGGFGLYAALFGARSVDSVDISEDVCARALDNARLNNLKINFHTHDVFSYLKEAVSNNRSWDVVILDPPSFTKSKKNLTSAVKGYKEINTNGLKVTSPNGILITASCSHHIDRQTFLDIVNESNVKAGRKIQLLKFAGASPDHPVLPSMPETQYLKLALFTVE